VSLREEAEHPKRMPSSVKPWQEVYLERFYPQGSWRRDGTRDFFRICQEYCGGQILEVGAGPSNSTSDYLGTLGELHGVDVDDDVLQNPALKTSSVIEDRFPFPNSTFYSCVSNYVCEHLDDPQQHLEEVWRVLKPGGVYVFRTPNRFHYIAMVSSLTPQSFHLKMANRLRAIDGHDPYPTRYRLNTRSQVQRLARQTGFEVEYLRLVEKEPSYGMSSRLLFLLFTAYERVVNATELLGAFRGSLFVVLRKSRTAAKQQEVRIRIAKKKFGQRQHD
jgi:SAM-dependent methyltransferase